MLFQCEPVLDKLGKQIGERFLIDGRAVSEEVWVAEFENYKGAGLAEYKPVKDWRKHWTPKAPPYPGPGPPVPTRPPMKVPRKVEVISFAEFERRWNAGSRRDRKRMHERLERGTLAIDTYTGTERQNEIVIEA